MPKFHIEKSNPSYSIIDDPDGEEFMEPGEPVVTYHIVADETFLNTISGKTVLKGDRGGLVSDESCLSKEESDSSWIFPGSVVVGRSFVYGNSAIEESTIVNSKINEKTIISRSTIYDCSISKSTLICVDRCIDTIIKGSTIISVKKAMCSIRDMVICETDISTAYDCFVKSIRMFGAKRKAILNNGKIKACEKLKLEFYEIEHKNLLIERQIDIDKMEIFNGNFDDIYLYRTEGDFYRIALIKTNVIKKEFMFKDSFDFLSVHYWKQEWTKKLIIRNADKLCENIIEQIIKALGRKDNSERFIAKRKNSIIAHEILELIFIMEEKDFDSSVFSEKIKINIGDKTSCGDVGNLFFSNKLFLLNLFHGDIQKTKKIISVEGFCQAYDLLPF